MKKRRLIAYPVMVIAHWFFLRAHAPRLMNHGKAGDVMQNLTSAHVKQKPLEPDEHRSKQTNDKAILKPRAEQ